MHVIDRGNARAEVFHTDNDYRAFVELMAAADEHQPLRVLAFCLMPNHFHLVLWPRADGEVSRWMHWLLTTQTARYRMHYGQRGIGHVWQGRFKAFPIQRDLHLLRVLRYVEANPARAGLVGRAERWPWSSLGMRLAGAEGRLLADWPVARPADWLERVNQPAPAEELETLRRSVNRGAPYGAEPWVARTAAALGLEFTLRPQGRPRKQDAGPNK